MLELTPIEHDALLEVCNIGVSQAARQLSLLLDDEVVITVPEVYLKQRSELLTYLGVGERDELTAVYQKLYGDYEGQATLLFHTSESHSLIHSLIGKIEMISGVDVREFEHEAIIEIGNIIISSCISAIANFLGDKIEFSVPTYKKCETHNIEETVSDSHDPMDVDIFIIKTKLQAAKRHTEGLIVLAFTSASSEQIKRKINDVIARIMSSGGI